MNNYFQLTQLTTPTTKNTRFAKHIMTSFMMCFLIYSGYARNGKPKYPLHFETGFEFCNYSKLVYEPEGNFGILPNTFRAWGPAIPITASLDYPKFSVFSKCQLGILAYSFDMPNLIQLYNPNNSRPPNLAPELTVISKEWRYISLEFGLSKAQSNTKIIDFIPSLSAGLRYYGNYGYVETATYDILPNGQLLKTWSQNFGFSKFSYSPFLRFGMSTVLHFKRFSFILNSSYSQSLKSPFAGDYSAIPSEVNGFKGKIHVRDSNICLGATLKFLILNPS